MPQKVLVAVDFQAPALWAVGYAVKLAARLKFPLVFMGVVPAEGEGSLPGGRLLSERLEEAHQQGLEDVVRQCQEEGVSLEIFFSSGPFFQEIRHFLDSPGNFKFLVVGVPQDVPFGEMEAFSAALKDLHRRFPGEILLVREQGKLARLTDLEPRHQGRKT
jgi:hypothetical protein